MRDRPGSDTKDPDSTLDFPFDWRDWLEEYGDGTDTIASVDVVVLPAIAGELELVGEPEIVDSIERPGRARSAVQVWLRGGRLGAVYGVRCRVTTAQDRVEDRTRWLRIDER